MYRCTGWAHEILLEYFIIRRLKNTLNYRLCPLQRCPIFRISIIRRVSTVYNKAMSLCITTTENYILSFGTENQLTHITYIRPCVHNVIVVPQLCVCVKLHVTHNVPCSSRKSMHCLKTVGSSSWSVPSVLRCTATSTVTPNTAESAEREGGEGGRERMRDGRGRGEKGRKKREERW